MRRAQHNMVGSPDPFDTLQAKLGLSLSNIANARFAADQTKKELETALGAIVFPETTALVVFGSLARREWTHKSDVDWTLLVNGPSDPEHFKLEKLVREQFNRHGFGEPGATQTFGTLTSSHELVHHIGGDEDSNRNLTRRILLLLESCNLFDSLERERVIRAVLQRYLVHGLGVPDPDNPRFVVPRFLLNDVVRLWRTFAVDYAAKKWQRADQGWALRNAKLRIPRKLTFAKGLLMCLDCELMSAQPPWSSGGSPAVGMIEEQLVNGCAELVSLTPLDMLSRVLLATDCLDIAKDILQSYDDYLAILNDRVKRQHLDTAVVFENAMSDHVYREARAVSDRFGDGLQKLFFKEHEELTRLTQKYGVF